MTTTLKELVSFSNRYLGIDKIKDYCPNGLQVEGCQHITKIVGGVTASQALIDVAIENGASAILVHHGYFWKGESAEITGIKRNRLKSLLENDISLIAYHLPLDVHSVVGNNAQLAQLLDFEIVGPLDPTSKPSIGQVGKLKQAMSAEALRSLISRRLNRECLNIGVPDKMVSTIGFCTGAAQGMIEQAVSMNLDAYLSGEISEPTVHISRETGVNYFSAGHHATERGGVKAFGAVLEQNFDIDFQFIDIDNPI